MSLCRFQFFHAHFVFLHFPLSQTLYAVYNLCFSLSTLVASPSRLMTSHNLSPLVCLCVSVFSRVVSLSLPFSLTLHTHKHTHKHSLAHTLAHSLAHTLAQSQAPKRTADLRALSPSLLASLSLSLSHHHTRTTHTHTHPLTRTHTRSLTRSQPHTLAQTHTQHVHTM